MTGTEFYNGISQLERFYQKTIEDFEKDIWYRELKNMKTERFNKIIQQVYIKCKFMPKLAEIFTINQEIPYVDKAKSLEVKKVECPKCKSIGIIFYTKLQEGKKYTFGARCTCENASNYSFKIPSIEQIGL